MKSLVLKLFIADATNTVNQSETFGANTSECAKRVNTRATSHDWLGKWCEVFNQPRCVAELTSKNANEFRQSVENRSSPCFC